MHRKRATAAYRIALALGLLGVALQLGAVTWHKFARSSDAQFLADLQATICHSGEAAGPIVPAKNSDNPSGTDPKADCLICKGLASSLAAILSQTDFAPFGYLAYRLARPASVDDVADAWVAAPRSRGPPHLA